jgi:uncharacterized protein (TIGR03437 family)
MELVDVALPSDSAGTGGTLALRLLAPRAGRAFFPEGAPADWGNYTDAYPEEVPDEVVQGPATRELASLVQKPGAVVAGAVKTASYGRAVAPGSLIAVFGSGMAGATATAEKTPLPRALAGTYVLIDGKPAPLLFASAGQINAQIPWEVRPGTVSVVVDGAKAGLTVSEAAPGIFKLQGERAALTAVPPGQYVQLYLTGQGPVQTTPGSGTAAPDAPLSLATLPVTATLGGKPAEVQFAGLAPRLVGRHAGEPARAGPDSGRSARRGHCGRRCQQHGDGAGGPALSRQLP